MFPLQARKVFLFESYRPINQTQSNLSGPQMTRRGSPGLRLRASAVQQAASGSDDGKQLNALP